MRLVDTLAWIEFLIGSDLGAALAPELPDRSEWLVPTMVQLELTKWLVREADEDKADRVIAFTETCVVADLDTAIALSAADLCVRHRLAAANAHRVCDRPRPRRRSAHLRPALRETA